MGNFVESGYDDVKSFIEGPPGDPDVLLEVVSGIRSELDNWVKDYANSVDGVFDDLEDSFQGTAGQAFQQLWTHGGSSSLSHNAHTALPQAIDHLCQSLQAYAQKLKKAQMEHWIQLGIMLGMLIVDALQLGMDPATDAATVGFMATAGEVLGQVAVGTIVSTAGDFVAQVGGDLYAYGSATKGFDWNELEEAAVGGAAGSFLGAVGSASIERFVSGGLLKTALTSVNDMAAGAGGSATTDLIFNGGINASDLVTGAMTSAAAGAASRGVGSMKESLADGRLHSFVDERSTVDQTYDEMRSGAYDEARSEMLAGGDSKEALASYKQAKAELSSARDDMIDQLAADRKFTPEKVRSITGLNSVGETNHFVSRVSFHGIDLGTLAADAPVNDSPPKDPSFVAAQLRVQPPSTGDLDRVSARLLERLA